MHILHLEDDGPLREILAAAIKAAEPEAELHQFIRSDDAMQHAIDHGDSIDLFILDIRVPGSMNGLEVAQRLRDLKCSGTIVLTSAYRPPDQETLRKLECDWFPKPWHIFQTTSRVLKLAQAKLQAQTAGSGVPSEAPPTAPGQKNGTPAPQADAPPGEAASPSSTVIHLPGPQPDAPPASDPDTPPGTE
jgi:DNA-binding response OmpR family regulator